MAFFFWGVVLKTAFAMSERLLGAVVGCHGDDRGILFPPCVAPIQVIVIPIIKSAVRRMNTAEKVLAEAERVKRQLADAGIRTRVDSRSAPFRNYRLCCRELTVIFACVLLALLLGR